MQNYLALRRLSSSPLGQVFRKVHVQLRRLPLKDAIAVLIQVAKGIAEGMMALTDAPDFATCVFNGLNAKSYFSGLTPADVSSPEALAKTIGGTKQAIVPLVDMCLKGADDVLKRINEGLGLISEWNSQSFYEVISQDRDLLADQIGKAATLFIQGNVQEGTATLVVLVETVTADIYKADKKLFA